MKHKLLTLVWLIMLLYSVMQPLAAQTEVKVTLTSGSETSYLVENVGKLYFANDQLVIKESTTTKTVSLSTIRKITFPGNSSGITHSTTNALVVYPNPATDILYIANLTTESIATIYSINGIQLLRQHVAVDGNINVSMLQSGLYLIKINNNVIKFSKL